MLIISPYRSYATWVFDDPTVGLVKEPFVAGIPEMIDVMVKDIPDAASGFKMLFSARPFPKYQAELTWQREEYGGNWYRWQDKDMEGWLCPALLLYFEAAPEKLYFKAEAMKKSP